ncbi:MAG: ATP-binding cassette domain-containing protein [Actinomycetales bacterium]|nr:ATP-binding cassette domain-containing protein [Actinomycetales bacterium]
MRPAAIRAQGWGWRHATREAWAVRGLDLAIEPGERVLLLGASGSGKSTLLRALAGVLGDDEGEQSGRLTLGGAPPALGRAGLVLQDPDSQVVLARVGDDVAFGAENLGVPREEIARRVPAALAAVGLDVALDRSTEALSGGQRQRLALAGALAMRPGVLLLDEPTANLDPAGVVEVRDAVARAVAASGATLVVVEHRVAVWAEVVDRIVVLSPRGLLADGPPARVLAAQGAELAARGIWVPGREPAAPERRRPADPAAPALVSARGLAVGREGVTVRAGLDLDVRPGSLLAVTGANGSGKSTLAQTLGGLRAPAGGNLDAFGRGSPHRWRSRELLPRLGSVFQNPEHQFLRRTVREEIELGPRELARGRRGGEPRLAAAQELLVRLRLAPLARANPFTLSGGEQRRLSVATALATAPEVLVLDEPTFGQDANTWAELVALCAELLDEGRAIVAATHDADFVAALADRRLELA